MRSLFVISLFLVSTFQVINANFFDSVQGWFSDHVEPQLEVRAPLSNTGYWNYLAIGGLYGRMVHFLLTDTNGFGQEIKLLQKNFQESYGVEYYADLESHVAESFPVGNAIFKSILMMKKIRNIRDKKTGKTLGDAFRILHNIAGDRHLVNAVVDRWHMIKDIGNVFKNPETPPVDAEQLNQLRILLLEHPEVLQKLVAQPDVMNRLSSSVLESLKGVDLMKGVESIQETALLLKSLYPKNYEQITQQLSKIKDERTGLSFAEGLETVSNIMKTPVFQRKLKKLLNTEFLTRVHEVSQQAMSDTVTKKPDPKELLRQAVPENIQATLKNFGIIVSLDKTKSLLDDAMHDRLMDTILQGVAKAEESPEGLTLDSISRSFAEQDINVTPVHAAEVMQLLQTFPPDVISAALGNVGISARSEDLFTLIEKASVVAPLDMHFDEESPDSSPAASTSQ